MYAPIHPFSFGVKRPAGLLLTLAMLIILLATMLSGCGGSGSASAPLTGRATLKILWPTSKGASRLIPAGSNSITASFLNGATTVATQTIKRPATGNTSTLVFAPLPTGNLTLQANAFPTTDGSGTAQAGASNSVTIYANLMAHVSLTMNSTITGISVTPAAFSVAVGSAATLTAAPVDVTGATVLAPSTLSWASSAPSIATVDSSGNVTGVAAGTATITVSESESGKSASVTCTVSAITGSATVGVN